MFRKCMFEKVRSYSAKAVVSLTWLLICDSPIWKLCTHVQIMWNGSSISKLYTIPQYTIIKSTLSAPPLVSMGNRILVNSLLGLVWGLNCCVLLDQ